MGIIASFIAAILSSTKDLFSKKISFYLDGALSAFASFLFAIPYYLVLLALLTFLGLEDFAFSSQFFLLVFLRASTDSIAEWMKMNAIGKGDISFVSNFISLAPLFLLITSPIITGDTISVKGAVAILLIVLGSLILIYKPVKEKKKSNYSAIAWGIGASFFLSLNACFDRLAVQIASPALSGFAMTLLAALFLLPSVVSRKGLFGSYSSCKKQLWLRGLAEVSFMVTNLFALQYLQAPYVAGIGKASLLFSIVGGRVIFREPEFLKRAIAGLLILTGVILIIWIEI